MRELVLLRHGEAENKTMSVDDIARPLTPRGKQQVQDAVKHLTSQSFFPLHIVASTAKRTVETATIASTLFGIDKAINFQPTLYMASLADILILIETFSEEWESVLLVGHNPGLSECASLLAQQELPHMEVAGTYHFQWPAHESWEDIANGIITEVKVKI